MYYMWMLSTPITEFLYFSDWWNRYQQSWFTWNFISLFFFHIHQHIPYFDWSSQHSLSFPPLILCYNMQYIIINTLYTNMNIVYCILSTMARLLCLPAIRFHIYVLSSYLFLFSNLPNFHCKGLSSFI